MDIFVNEAEAERLKKYLLYGVMILWAVILVRQIIHIDNAGAEDVITAFEDRSYINSETTLDCFFYYGDIYMTVDERRELLEGIIRNLGITSEYSYNTDKTEQGLSSILNYEFQGGSIECRLTTVETDTDNKITYLSHYISVNMKFDKSPETAWYYRGKLKEVLKKLPYMSITPDVNMTFVGELSGNLTRETCVKISDEIMEQLDAGVEEIPDDSGIICAYGYTEKLEEYATVGGRKVNVNIAFSYDERKNVTVMYFATPIINLDF